MWDGFTRRTLKQKAVEVFCPRFLEIDHEINEAKHPTKTLRYTWYSRQTDAPKHLLSLSFAIICYHLLSTKTQSVSKYVSLHFHCILCSLPKPWTVGTSRFCAAHPSSRDESADGSETRMDRWEWSPVKHIEAIHVYNTYNIYINICKYILM